MPANGGRGERDYLGIVIQQSLKDRTIVAPARVLARKRVKTWVFLLVGVAEADLEEHIRVLQKSMVTDDTWYAHYFRDQELVVVFRDAVFRAGLEPDTWGPLVEYGLNKGIPLEQLDFKPRTFQGAGEFFGLEVSPAL